MDGQPQRDRESSLDRYVRMEQSKQREEQPAIQDHEIRITGPGKTRNYIAYATGLLTQKGCSAVELKAMGQAINKTVTIAEIIKRRILGLHQNNQITSIAIQDTWEPIEEGLDTISVTRHVSVISITLSTVPLDPSSPGYQPPLPPEMVKTHLSPAPHNGPLGNEGDIWGHATGATGSGAGLQNPASLQSPSMGGSKATGGSGGSSAMGSGCSLMDTYGGMIMPAAALDVQQLLQVQGMHDGGGQLGLHSDMTLGPVAHFDGRAHVRNQGKGRGNHRVGSSSSGIGSGIGSGNNSMMGGGMA